MKTSASNNIIYRFSIFDIGYFCNHVSKSLLKWIYYTFVSLFQIISSCKCTIYNNMNIVIINVICWNRLLLNHFHYTSKIKQKLYKKIFEKEIHIHIFADFIIYELRDLLIVYSRIRLLLNIWIVFLRRTFHAYDNRF